jgi:hypothetical protein
MVISFSNAWWRAIVGASGVYQVDIYAWGLRKSEDLLSINQIVNDVTPFYQTVLAWGYLAVSVGLVLWSTWIKGTRGRILLGFVGLSYIAYALVAVLLVILDRVRELAIPLQGFIDAGAPGSSNPDLWYVPVTTSLQPWYFLALIAGGACLLLSLHRRVIEGHPEVLKEQDTEKVNS